MSDEDKNTITTEPEENQNQIVLESKGDWRNLFDSEDLKKNETLLKHESIDSLASEYLKLSTKLQSKTDVKPLTKDSSDEDFLKTAEAMLDVKKDNYSEDFKFKEEAFKYRLPSRLVEPFLKDMTEQQTKLQEASKKELIEKHKKEINEAIPTEVFETRYTAGLEELGFTPDEFKKLIPEEHRTKPSLVKAITNLGKSRYSRQQKQIEDNEDNLPNDTGILKDQLSALVADRLKLKLNNQSTIDINEKIGAIKSKYNKLVKQKIKEDSLSNFSF